MKTKWYDNDWFICILAGISLIGMVIGNYYIHGGHISW
jgi:predicted ATP-grasp superfamily ATP-dependent carboligase